MIDPKDYTLNAFKGNGKKLAAVLQHYWKHVNYYKNAKVPVQQKSVTNPPPATDADIKEIFGAEAEQTVGKGV